MATTLAAVLLCGAVAACSSDTAEVSPSATTTSPATTVSGSTIVESDTEPTTTGPVDSAAPTETSVTTDATIGDGSLPARLDPEVIAELDAVGFADELSASLLTMVDPSAALVDRERAGVDYQLVLRELADRPDLDDAVLAAVDPAALPAVGGIVGARQFLQARSAARPPQPLSDVLPAWTIVEPEPVDTLLAHYAEAEQLTGIAWYWLAAIHLQETRMGRIQGVSSAGAVGPMQFLPTTWEACCVGDPLATRDAIIGAATYLAQSGGPGDMAAAVFQYNPNDGYVAVVTAYAESLRDEPELYPGYHGFQVFFGSSVGTVRLPIGYDESAPIDAAAYLAANPHDAA